MLVNFKLPGLCPEPINLWRATHANPICLSCLPPVTKTWPIKLFSLPCIKTRFRGSA